MSRFRIKPYLIGTLVPLAVGGLSALLSGAGEGFYETVNLPAFAPPALLFPIVWSILFLLMGYSSVTVFLHRERDRSHALDGLVLYTASLVVNFFYPIFFFRFRFFLFSFFWLILLLSLVLLTVWKYAKVSRAAARAQLPYAAWVAFACVLTLAIFLLNR
jgi:tryptophan-rich sensory protein